MVLTARGTEEDSKLARGLGLLDATMIVVGSMIGSGIFIVSAESSRLVGAPGWLLVAWAIAGLMTITGALCCAELAAMMPRAGGQYVFLREAYGPGTAFLFGWSFLLVIQTGTIAAVAIAFANFMGVLTDWVSATTYVIAPIVFGGYALSLSTQQLVAVAMILLLTLTNTRGLRLGKLDSEYLHRHQDRRAERLDCCWPCAWLELRECRLYLLLVEPMGERLERRGDPA